MKLQDSSGTVPDFSPTLAVIFTAPLVFFVAALFGPELWDILANSIGLTFWNPTRAFRDWYLERFGVMTMIAVLLFSPQVAIFCLKTRGHDTLRRALLGVHGIVSVLMIGAMFGIVFRIFAR